MRIFEGLRIILGQRIIRTWAACAVIAAALWWSASPVEAQTNWHTWYASTGTDATGCGGITNPCNRLDYAITQTKAGGEVQCKDANDSLTTGVTLIQSITITCDIPQSANSYLTGLTNLEVNLGGPNDAVVVRGLNFHGGETNFSGQTFPAINFRGSGTLVLDNVKVTGWGTSGVLFQPNGTANMVVTNSLFARNGNITGGSGAGIRIWPQAGGSARVHLDRVTISNNAFGVAVDGSASTNGINMTISGSVLSGNIADGLVATTSQGTSPLGVTMVNTKSTNNGYGVRSIGNNVTVRMENSTVVGNNVGLSALSGGALTSAGNNIVEANGTNGSFSGSISLK